MLIWNDGVDGWMRLMGTDGEETKPVLGYLTPGAVTPVVAVDQQRRWGRVKSCQYCIWECLGPCL